MHVHVIARDKEKEVTNFYKYNFRKMEAIVLIFYGSGGEIKLNDV